MLRNVAGWAFCLVFPLALFLFIFGYYGFRSSFPLHIEVGQYKSRSPPTSSSSVLPLSPVSLPGQRLCAQQVWPHTASTCCVFILIIMHKAFVLCCRAIVCCSLLAVCTAAIVWRWYVSSLSLCIVVDATRWLMLVWSQVNAGGCLESVFPSSSRVCLLLLKRYVYCYMLPHHF